MNIIICVTDTHLRKEYIPLPNRFCIEVDYGKNADGYCFKAFFSDKNGKIVYTFKQQIEWDEKEVLERLLKNRSDNEVVKTMFDRISTTIGNCLKMCTSNLAIIDVDYLREDWTETLYNGIANYSEGLG